MTGKVVYDLPLEVSLEDDGETVVLEWDEENPLAIELGLSQWSDQQWIEALRAGLDEYDDEKDDEIAVVRAISPGNDEPQ